MESIKKYDVIIIGGGHAGVEAAFAASKLVSKVALVTYSLKDIAFLPCNVSIGGSAKGIVVRELYALGGIMPIAADETQLQTKILNKSKGPAVQALRAQIDKNEYPQFILKKLKAIENLEIIEDEVLTLDISKDKQVKGLFLKKNKYIYGEGFVLATGTFLNSKTMQGEEIVVEGPDGKETNLTISEQFRKLNIQLLRLKTGTPPRIAKESIDFNSLQEEPGSKEPIYFSEYYKVKKKYENIPAWLAYTNPKTHIVIKNNFDKSYLFSDEITGTGPRYCPSIEDKVKRFSSKERHQIFLELETREGNSVYLSGISSSLPRDVQEKFVRTISGLENAKFLRYAYAIEYDSINPNELNSNLEFKKIRGLFSAGQINGTSGYEEAAAQGLMAGVNAANFVNNTPPFILGRDQAYIGVMIDDITTKGIIDPYRLLTSRAEYRLLLRSDNATKRLYDIAYQQHLISEDLFLKTEKKVKILNELIEIFKKENLTRKDSSVCDILLNKEIEKIKIYDYIKRPNFSIFEIIEFLKEKFSDYFQFLNLNDIANLEIEIKYYGYINKQKREVKKYLNLKNLKIKEQIDYSQIPSLSKEAIEKLTFFQPNDIYKASNIPGVNNSDIIILLNHLTKKHLLKK